MCVCKYVCMCTRALQGGGRGEEGGGRREEGRGKREERLCLRAAACVLRARAMRGRQLSCKQARMHAATSVCACFAGSMEEGSTCAWGFMVHRVRMHVCVCL